MSYIKDKIIIDFLCEAEKILQSESIKVLSPLYSFVFGFKLHSHLKTPKDIPSLLEHFSTIHQFEEFQAINEHQRRKLFLNVLSNPYCSIEQEIGLFTSDSIEESKHAEQEQVSKERYNNCIHLYEKVENVLFEHIAYNEEDNRFQPIDFIMWGFFSSQYFSKTPPKDIFDKLNTIRQAQISGLVNHNQKMRIYLRLHNDWDLDLNTTFDKLIENPSLGTKPLSSMIIPEEQLNKILLEQLSLEEKIEVENARIEQEKIDNEGVCCNICLLDLHDKDEDIYMMDICIHNFHEACLTDYLKNCMKERKLPVKCPEESCKVEFTDLDLKELLDSQDLEKFYQYSIEQYLIKNAKEMSHCPTPGCNFAFMRDPNETRLQCPSCGYDYCLKCFNYWHEDECEAVERFIEMAKKLDLKACPSCKFWVEKTDGCRHMVCRCGEEFCYDCGSLWSDDVINGCEFTYHKGFNYYQNVYHSLFNVRANKWEEDDIFANQNKQLSENQIKRKRRKERKKKNLPSVRF